MNNIRSTGYKALTWIQGIGLLVIAIATVVAMSTEILSMVASKTVTLSDLLLLFIYLEILEMVAIYLDTGKLPVRIPLYIAIVAIARYMILDMKNLDTMRMLGFAGAVLIIAIAVLIIRYGHHRYPYSKIDDR
jgi:protein PsiE